MNRLGLRVILRGTQVSSDGYVAAIIDGNEVWVNIPPAIQDEFIEKYGRSVNSYFRIGADIGWSDVSHVGGFYECTISNLSELTPC